MIGTPVGIVVDRVLEVTQITSDNISEPPGFENESDKKNSLQELENMKMNQ